MKAKIKKWTKPVIILAVIGGIGFFAVNSVRNSAAAAAAAMMQPPRTVTLQKGELTNVISVNGTVYSKDVTNVYSNVSAPIKAVHVEVGDVVQEGDLLAELDSAELERSLRSAQASLSSDQATAQLALEQAKKDLERYQQNQTDPAKNDSLIGAQDKVATAERDLDEALVTVGRARKALKDLKDDHEIDKDNDEDGKYTAAKQAHEDAQRKVEAAQIALENAERDLKKAQEDNKTSTGDSLEDKQDTIKKAELGTDFTTRYIDIQKTREDIEKCQITAPVSGVITSVAAVEGASGSGLLFVIQDGDNLKIVANIKEYDVAEVSIGDPVIIKTDALTGREFQGVLAKIAPASNEVAAGSAATAAKASDTTSGAEFASEITVTGDKEGLRIGMNTKLSIITEERHDIYSVPYEAVGQNEAGELVIYTMETDEAGVATTRELVVTVGMENDLFSEVSGPDLVDGIQIYSDALQGQSAYAMSQAAAAAGADGEKVSARRAVQ